MSTYVMSDLHGNYQAYISMLKEIDFKDEDMLYILGDILDRGPQPIKIILDIMKRTNIEVIAGNHELMSYECLKFLMKEITEESLQDVELDMIEKLLNWQQNGAVTTTDEFHKCDRLTQEQIISFIEELEVYDEIVVNNNTFILVHAGFGNFKPNKELWEYHLDELVWERLDYDKQYFENKYIITGHTPTMFIDNNPRPGYIYQSNNNIAMDCGCSFQGGRLGCLRLDDMKEFYVEDK